MSKAVMPPLDALRNARAAAGERQRSDTIWSNDDVRICIPEVMTGFEYVAIAAKSAKDVSCMRKLQRRDFNPDFELI